MPNENPLAGADLARLRPTLSQIGGALGTTGRWIGALRAKGIMPADGATLRENVAAWIAYQTDRADG